MVFTFWMTLISILVSVHNYLGYDDKGLIFFLFGIEPILMKAIYTEPFRSWMLTESGDISWFGYILRILTGLFYGILFDSIINGIKKSFRKWRQRARHTPQEPLSYRKNSK